MVKLFSRGWENMGWRIVVTQITSSKDWICVYFNLFWFAAYYSAKCPITRWVKGVFTRINWLFKVAPPKVEWIWGHSWLLSSKCIPEFVISDSYSQLKPRPWKTKVPYKQRSTWIPHFNRFQMEWNFCVTCSKQDEFTGMSTDRYEIYYSLA